MYHRKHNKRYLGNFVSYRKVNIYCTQLKFSLSKIKYLFTMKFDQLPNEILIEYFKYLNALDIFYSFYQLNYRFHTLIRNISLHLNLHHINKSLFDQFCHEMLLNPQLKNQIISLQLSNKNTCLRTIVID